MQATSTETLFSSTLALPPEERSAFLEKACTNADHRARIENLLCAETEARTFVRETSNSEPHPEAIGDYRLLHELGEGGCGTVYLAEQLAPVRREVALKVIKLGMDTKAVINRFEAERQALAMMDHPHIARVFDAGATPTGRPYFVMELVRGIKITEYCEQCRLTLDERLEVFIQVCQAIQHAHLKGVIHRDIKPSNVLVTLHDGEPVAKVIDFGVAKAMQGRLTDETLYTLFDQFIGTPAYVSPEQTQPGALGVDTRSDVYSLGVLLYELLTGETPFDNEDLLQSGLETMRRRLLAEAPPRPSKRIDTLSLRLQRQPQDARTPSHFQRVERVRGDLDWIVMRCLEKDKERRYQSVGDLAADLQRFLRKEPIAARAPSPIYTLRKFAERHRNAVIAASLVLCALLGATAVSTWQAVRATRAERLAQESIDALVGVFAVADPFAAQGAPFSPDELLQRASRTAYEELGAFPLTQARLLESIGIVLRRRGRHKEAAEHIENAIAVLKNHDGPSGAMAKATLELAIAVTSLGEHRRAERLIEETEALIQHGELERSMLAARALRFRGTLTTRLGDIYAARRYLIESKYLAMDLVGPDDPHVAETMTALATNYSWTDQFENAEQMAREAVAIYERHTSPTNPDRLYAESSLAEILLVRGRLEEAAHIFQASLAKRVEIFGPDSAQVADTHDSLAKVRRSQGALADAERHAREAVRASRAAIGRHDTTGYYLSTLAGVLLAKGDYPQAESAIREALAIYAENLSKDHDYVRSAQQVLAEALLGMNRLADAREVLEICLGRIARTNPLPWRRARIQNAYGELLLREGRRDEARQLIVESYRTLATAPGAAVWDVAAARERVVKLYEQEGKHRELETLLASISASGSVAVTSGAASLEASMRSSATVPPEPDSSVAH
jgi:serine/threonine protein kinase